MGEMRQQRKGLNWERVGVMPFWDVQIAVSGNHLFTFTFNYRANISALFTNEVHEITTSATHCAA